jgi:SAM-dependent methyltransferase
MTLSPQDFKRQCTAAKLRRLMSDGEDYEWYPTTEEILSAMKADLWAYLRQHRNDYAAGWRGNKELISIHTEYDYSGATCKKTPSLSIDTFLDIGSGDGRVLAYFPASKKYGIEIARAQADDLIRRGVFLIGRDFMDVSLFDQDYGLVFCNPPYSVFEMWVEKILYECNFALLYLVLPVRWQNSVKIKRGLERYEASIIGEYDFSEADRKARGRVNLIRINAPWEKCEKQKGETGTQYYQRTLENAFERWVRDYIGTFPSEEEYSYEVEEANAVALKKAPIDQLVDDYETEKAALGEAFAAIGKLSPAIFAALSQGKKFKVDKASMLEIIKQAISGLKSKYWRAAFDKLDTVRERMTYRTRDNIFNNIREFETLDFNVDNIYSIMIWLINHTNVGILDQIGDVFDALTSKEYITAYKSNRHWVKGDWRHTCSDCKYEKLPSRWKLGLDYRVVVETYNYHRYGDRQTIIEDFMVICRNLGFPISKGCVPDYKLHSTEQKFYTEDGELAFAMRYYTGNQNAHLKINQKLLLKFNVEVAKIRKWIMEPEDIQEEFAVGEAEAEALWNSGLTLLGVKDMPMLEYKREVV